ncbi:hypothetical protein OSK38_29335, partial [Escherichia coli]|nr:hypothetical protein [Escherichia coli]
IQRADAKAAPSVTRTNSIDKLLSIDSSSPDSKAGSMANADRLLPPAPQKPALIYICLLMSLRLWPK